MGQLVDYLPVAAAMFGIPQYLPQIIKLRVTHDTAGVSWSWATLTSLNNTAWLVYFILSGYWTAIVPSSAAALLAGAVATMLAIRGSATSQAAVLIGGWTALLVAGYTVAGHTGLGNLLTMASIIQVTPSIWTAYRTRHPTGISRLTWMLIFGELSCWTIYGLHRSDPRLITLGITGVTASVLMLTRIWRTSTRKPSRWRPTLLQAQRRRNPHHISVNRPLGFEDPPCTANRNEGTLPNEEDRCSQAGADP
ncbi:PQ-loop domain-containing transporter [Sphaerisporangium flaviroseum]|uniref:PQ-loop domain-containing transporter n=1 Tax=Sphaerisporangium flaviroseum TaxID=509199 RepID=UPI0031EA8973